MSCYMPTSLLYLQQGNGKKSKKLIKIVDIDKKSFYRPNDLRNFNETFWKDVSYDNIKSHRKLGFCLKGLKQLKHNLLLT